MAVNMFVKVKFMLNFVLYVIVIYVNKLIEFI